MDAVLIVLLVGIFLLLGLLLLRRQSPMALLNLKEAEHEKILQYFKDEKLRVELEKSQLKDTFDSIQLKLIKAEEKLAVQSQYIQELHQKFKLEFENIANKILEEKTTRFTLQNKENLALILNPLKENIKLFEEKVEKVYKDESTERNKLEGVLKEMMEQTKQIQADANNLTNALKGDSKKQGNWGEIVLERVLERSGLIRDSEYRVQPSFTNDTGTRSLPDVIIDLPDQKNLIIDAKISLSAYERMVNAESDAEKNLQKRLHLQSLKAHIDSLASKQYQHLYTISSPDFVLLFMPVESMFSITMQADHEIFNYAWSRKVVIVSPTTLLATLRTIASIWTVDRQNKNVFTIAAEAGALYDKFVGFLDEMEKVSKNLGMAQKSHEEAIKKLHSGSGNIVSRIEKIKKLGAKTKNNKQIEPKFLDNPEYLEGN